MAAFTHPKSNEQQDEKASINSESTPVSSIRNAYVKRKKYIFLEYQIEIKDKEIQQLKAKNIQLIEANEKYQIGWERAGKEMAAEKLIFELRKPFDTFMKNEDDLVWLGWLDSNQRSRDQNPLPCRLATPH